MAPAPSPHSSSSLTIAARPLHGDSLMQHSSTAATPSPVDNDRRAGFIIYFGTDVYAPSSADLLSESRPPADGARFILDSGATVHDMSSAGLLSRTRPPADGARFIFDSGATVHATGCADLFPAIRPPADGVSFIIDSGATVHDMSSAGLLSRTRPPADGAGFIIDSGAAVHATSCADLLSGTRPAADGARWFRTRVGKDCAVTYVGSIDTPRFAVPDVHLVPGLGHDGSSALISVRQLARRGLAVTFGGDYCSVKERSTGAVVGEGRLREDDGFYYLDYLRVPRR